MKKIIGMALLSIGVASSLMAQEVSTQKDLKIAIDKLISTSITQNELEVVENKVIANTEEMKKLDSKIQDLEERIINISIPQGSSGGIVYKTNQTGVVFNCYYLNLRKSPSLSLAPRTVLERGDSVKIIGGSDNGWMNVTTSKGSGWVSGLYIKSK